MFHSPVFTNNRVFEARMNVTQRETTKAAGRTWSAFRVATTFYKDGQQVQGVNGTFWISDDDRHVPLRATADTTYGPVTGTLVKYLAASAGPFKAFLP